MRSTITIIGDRPSDHRFGRGRRSSGVRRSASVTERDPGTSALEVIVVVLIVGLLVSAVIFAVSGLRASAAETGCAAARRHLASAVEAFDAEYGSGPIPATGVDHDRFERTLVDAGFLGSVSTTYDIDASGVIDPEGNSPC